MLLDGFGVIMARMCFQASDNGIKKNDMLTTMGAPPFPGQLAHDLGQVDDDGHNDAGSEPNQVIHDALL